MMARFASVRFVSVGVSAAMVAVFGVVLSAVPGGESAPAGAANPTPTPVYDSTVAPLPGNLPSVGFEATQTSEFGDQVSLGGTARELNNVVVTMSSWACQSGAWVMVLALPMPV